MGRSSFKDMSDLNLWSYTKEGNQMAFQQIYHRYWEGLYKYTHNILNDKWLSEDVLHEVFTNIWRKREKSQINNLKSYLFNAVRNRALLKIRDDKFTKLDEHIICKLNLTPEIELQFDCVEVMQAIEKAAQSLPPRCRDIFYMSRFQHYSTAEIARHFNISTRTVENQLSLALKHLRAKLGNALFMALFFSAFLTKVNSLCFNVN